MKSVSFLGALLLTCSFMSGMERIRDSIIFKNNKDQTVEVPAQVVRKARIFNTIYQNHELLSFGTQGRITLSLPQFLQNVELIQECIDYDSLDLRDLTQRISSYQKVTDIPHLIQIINMSSYLGLDKKITTTIEQAIGRTLQSSQNRCLAFKNNLLSGIQGNPEILNGIAQEIIKPAKYFWLMQVRNGNVNINNAQEQLDNYLTPQRALLLLDSYQNKVNGTPISYLPGDEKVLPRVLQNLITLSFSQRMALGWQKTPAAYKWTIAGTGAASLLAAGYGLYTWYTSR